MKVLYQVTTFICLIISGACWTSPAYADLTKQDIEEMRRIIREEVDRVDKRIDELRAEMKTEIRDVRAEIKDVRTDLMNFMLWGFGILFFGMLSLITFVLWDRRSALAPAVRKAKELEEEGEKVKKVLKVYALQEPRLAVVLREVGWA